MCVLHMPSLTILVCMWICVTGLDLFGINKTREIMTKVRSISVETYQKRIYKAVEATYIDVYAGVCSAMEVLFR